MTVLPTALQATPESMGASALDVIFALDAPALAREHAQALQQALCAQWPWLNTDPGAGIHPIKVVPGTQEEALLSRRARLVLRVGEHRAAELLAQGALELEVAGQRLRLGAAHTRELQPHATLYAYKVAAASADEPAFMAALAPELAQLGIASEPVCGKRQRLLISGQVQHTFSLMLHQLSPQQSLRVQQCGLGPHRLLGCGLFVPHKSAAAVGA